MKLYFLDINATNCANRPIIYYDKAVEPDFMSVYLLDYSWDRLCHGLVYQQNSGSTTATRLLDFIESTACNDSTRVSID